MKKWQKPELTVFLRTKSQEAILVTCKGANGVVQASASADAKCIVIDCLYNCVDIVQS